MIKKLTICCEHVNNIGVIGKDSLNGLVTSMLTHHPEEHEIVFFAWIACAMGGSPPFAKITGQMSIALVIDSH